MVFAVVIAARELVIGAQTVRGLDFEVGCVCHRRSIPGVRDLLVNILVNVVVDRILGITSSEIRMNIATQEACCSRAGNLAVHFRADLLQIRPHCFEKKTIGTFLCRVGEIYLFWSSSALITITCASVLETQRGCTTSRDLVGANGTPVFSISPLLDTLC